MNLQLTVLTGLISLLTISGLFLFSNQPTELSLQNQNNIYDMNVITSSYQEWAKKFGKQISSSSFKFSNFVESYKKVQEHNSKNSSYKLGLNKFADMSDEEFKAIYLMKESEESNQQNLQSIFEQESEKQQNKVQYFSGKKDFREHGVVNAVQNQGNCGSCYTFAGAQATESAYALQTDLDLMKFSEQQLVSCSSVFFGNNGCNGGFGNSTFSYIVDYGINLLENYPYVSGEDGEVPACSVTQGEYKISSYTEVFGNGNCLNIQQAAKNQPLYARAIATDWKLYQSGVYTGCSSEDPDLINHGIGIIGYDTTSNNSEERYWLIRNSWGEDWGENGYMKLQFGNSCAICYQSFFPTV